MSNGGPSPHPFVLRIARQSSITDRGSKRSHQTLITDGEADGVVESVVRAGEGQMAAPHDGVEGDVVTATSAGAIVVF